MTAFSQWIGAPFPIEGRNNGPTVFALNAATDQMEYIFQARESITCTRLMFRYGTRTGTPPTYIISLQGVGSTGNPDGTILGGGSPASVTFTPPASTAWNSTWQEVTLANSVALTVGSFYSVVIAYSSGTIDGSNNSSFTSHDTVQALPKFPYAIQNDGGSRARVISGVPVFGYGSATKVYGRPIVAAYTSTIDSTTTPDEVAQAFLLPLSIVASYKIAAVRFCGIVAAGNSVVATLYSGTTALQSVTLDSDVVSANGVAGVITLFFTGTLATLTGGQVYRVGFAPQAVSAAFGVRGFSVNAAADLEAYPGGTDWYFSSRTDAGAWADTLTQRLHVELLLSDWTLGASGIGVLTGGGLAR